MHRHYCNNNQIFNFMEKTKLKKMRLFKGFTQQQIADQLCMGHSTYNRREKGETAINIDEWEKLAKILNVSLDEIFESDEKQSFNCNDNASANFLGTNFGTNNIYAVPKELLENQQKYIIKLEKENEELKRLLERK